MSDNPRINELVTLSIEDLLAREWHGDDWHCLSKTQSIIVDRLIASGHMRFDEGFIFSTETP